MATVKLVKGEDWKATVAAPLYASPDTAAAKVAAVTAGTIIRTIAEATGDRDGGSWRLTETGGKVGWFRYKTKSGVLGSFAPLVQSGDPAVDQGLSDYIARLWPVTTPVPPQPTPIPPEPTPIPPEPTPVPPPTSGIPPIPAGAGTVLRKDFADGSLAPFRILTYPNDHPGDLMIQYGNFVTDSAHVSVHDGFLDLRCTRRSDGRWDQAFVGTGMDGRGGAATFAFQYGTARAMVRLNSGKGAWQGAWYLIADAWSSPEIDWPELIGSLTANLHGTSADGQVYRMTPPPSDEWHEYGIVKAPGYIAFLYDGREVARRTVAMSARMGLLADAKVGLSTPDGTTPSPLFLHVAWWVVDP